VGDTAKTPGLVPLGRLLDLAYLGSAMRSAQRAYFDARKRMPHVRPDAEWRAARDLEKRFDSAVADVLGSDRQALPGMAGDEDDAG
jgi:hypothetical protein